MDDFGGDWKRVAVALHRAGASNELVRHAVCQQQQQKKPGQQKKQQQFLRYLATYKKEQLLMSPRSVVPLTDKKAAAGPDRPLSPGVQRAKKTLARVASQRTGTRALVVGAVQKDAAALSSSPPPQTSSSPSSVAAAAMPPSANDMAGSAASLSAAAGETTTVLRLLSAPERDALRLFFGAPPADRLLVLCQAAVRRWLARRRTKKIRKQAVHRQKVLQEIMDSERVFSRSLGQVVDLFQGPLKERVGDTGEGRTLVARLFCNIDMINAFSQELLAALELRFAEAGSVTQATRVGDIFQQFVSYMKVFGAYCAGYDGAASLLQEILQAADAAAATATAGDDAASAALSIGDVSSPRSPRSKPGHQLTPDEERRRLLVTCGRWIRDQQSVQLASLLITPVQRLPRYRMLLEDLLKHTWPSHGDWPALQQAVAGVAAAAADVNLVVKRAEGSARVQQLAKQLRGGADLASDPDRLLVREGQISLRVQGLKPRSVQFRGLLFTDTFVVAQHDKIVHRVSLRDALVQDMRDMQLIKNAFQLVTRELPLAIVCASKADKRGWLTALADVVRQCGGTVGAGDNSLLLENDDQQQQHQQQSEQQTAAGDLSLSSSSSGSAVRDRTRSVSGGGGGNSNSTKHQQQHLLSPRSRSRRGTGLGELKTSGGGSVTSPRSGSVSSGGSGIFRSGRSPSIVGGGPDAGAVASAATSGPVAPKYQVKVVGTEERVLPKVHTVYVLQVTSLTTGTLHRVFRRYSEFDSLVSALRRRLGSAKGLPALPKKTFNLRFQSGHMSAKALESRQLGLDSFVQALTMRPDVMATDEVHQFLRLPGTGGHEHSATASGDGEFMLSVFLVDKTSKTFRVKSDTTCADVCNLMCRKLRISDQQGDCFSLFLSLPMSYAGGSTVSQAASGVLRVTAPDRPASAPALTSAATPPATAVTTDISSSSSSSSNISNNNNKLDVDSDSRFERVLDDDEFPVVLLKESGEAGSLVYRKAVYLAQDMGDASSLPVAERELVYAQARSDILRARIVTGETTAVRLAAISVVKEFGSSAGDLAHAQFRSFINKFVPRHLVKKRPADQWEQTILDQARALLEANGNPTSSSSSSSFDALTEYLSLVSQSATYGTQMWPCEPLGETKKEFTGLGGGGGGGGGGGMALAVRYDGVLAVDTATGAVLREFPFAHYSFNSTPKGFVVAGPLDEYSFKTRAGLALEDSVNRHIALK